MNIELSTTLTEIKYRLELSKCVLDITKIINLLPPRNWTFTFIFDETKRVYLKIQTTPNINYTDLINGAIESVFDGEEIRVVVDGRRYVSLSPLALTHLNSNSLTLNDDGAASVDDASLTIVGFAHNPIPSEFTQSDKLKSYLQDNTWVGSSFLTRDRYKITFRVLDTTLEFSNVSNTEMEVMKKEMEGVPTLQTSHVLGEPSIGSLKYTGDFYRKDVVFRWTYTGVINSKDKLQWLVRNLKDWPPGEFEINIPSSAIAPDGTFALEGNILKLPQLLERFVNEFILSIRYKDFQEKCDKFEKEQSARSIDHRKAALLNASFVFFNDELIYKRPTSEMEVVCLHQKLEGKGALPFAKFVSLEYTPKLGIDAIVHFKIHRTEALHKFATVEFEYQYENFFRHKHPVEQTNLIICWERSGDLAAPTPTNDPDIPWLSRLAIEGTTIYVIEISKYPGITLGRLAEDTP